MIFCKDCRFFDPEVNPISKLMDDDGKQRNAMCTHRSSLIVDDSDYHEFLVTGVMLGSKTRFTYCSTMREYACGENAKFFEPKVSDRHIDDAGNPILSQAIETDFPVSADE